MTGTFLASYGLDTLMVREVTKNQEQGKTFLSNIIGLKIVISVITILLIALIFRLLSLDSRTTHLLLIFSISIIFNSLSQTLWHYGDCFEKFIYHSFLWPLSNFIKSVTGIALVFIFRDIEPLILGLVFAEIIYFVFAYYFIKNKFGSFSPGFDFSVWQDLFIKSTPLAIGIILSAIYFRVDVVMLKLMREDEVVGWYSAAYKLIEVFTVIPSSILLILFTSLVKDYHTDIFKFKDKLCKCFLTYLFFGIFFSAFLSIFSEKIISIIYGNSYLPSVFALQILSWALMFIFINYLLSHALISAGKEKINTIYLLIITVINIGINLLLIPKYGHKGAAWATLISEIFLTILLAFSIKTIMTLHSAASPPVCVQRTGRQPK